MLLFYTFSVLSGCLKVWVTQQGSRTWRHVTFQTQRCVVVTQEVIFDVKYSPPRGSESEQVLSASLLLFGGKDVTMEVVPVPKAWCFRGFPALSRHHRVHQVQRHKSNFPLQETDSSAISLIRVPLQIRALNWLLHMLRAHFVHCTGSQRMIKTLLHRKFGLLITVNNPSGTSHDRVLGWNEYPLQIMYFLRVQVWVKYVNIHPHEEERASLGSWFNFIHSKKH